VTIAEAQANLYEPCYITVDVASKSYPLQAFDMGYLWYIADSWGFYPCRYDGDVILLTLEDKVTPILEYLEAGNPPSEYWSTKSRKTNTELRAYVNTPRQLELF
jgi:hypothetical protein